MILYFSLHFKEREAIQSCLSWKETFTICIHVFSFTLKYFKRNLGLNDVGV